METSRQDYNAILVSDGNNFILGDKAQEIEDNTCYFYNQSNDSTNPNWHIFQNRLSKHDPAIGTFYDNIRHHIWCFRITRSTSSSSKIAFPGSTPIDLAYCAKKVNGFNISRALDEGFAQGLDKVKRVKQNGKTKEQALDEILKTRSWAIKITDEGFDILFNF